MGLKPTDEQRAVIESSANTLVVNAFAGTGKTATLVKYAEARPSESMLYLAFNRSIKEDAEKKFPSNVRCVTTHGLAYSQFGRQFNGKVGQPKAAGLARTLNQDIVLTGSALETISNFLYSSAKDIDPDKHLVSRGKSDPNNVFDLARTIWKRMQDPNDRQVWIPHDGYLKLYQKSEPVINSKRILLDEGQDSNAVTLDIIGRQSGAKVFVGDENQAIYAFRRAVDALNKVDADEHLYLTSSFRFGRGIAALATLLLQDWKGETKSISGLGKHQNTLFKVDMSKPHAIIGRTNSGLFDAAVRTYRARQPYGFVGGADGYRLDMIKDAYYLKYGQRSLVKDPQLLAFQSFAELEAYATAMDDKELKMLVRIIDEYGHEIPKLTEKIKENAVPELKGQEIALTTAHKSKGLEFDSVVLLDDFPELKVTKKEGAADEFPSEEEINIMYVAATRAQRCLQINNSIADWLIEIGMWKAVEAGNVSGFTSQHVIKKTKRRASQYQAKSGTGGSAAIYNPTTELLEKLMKMSELSAPEKEIIKTVFQSVL